MGEIHYPKRKPVRLKGHDYSTPGYYFITLCTLNKEKLLCEITTHPVGTVALDGPLVHLTQYGKIVQKHMEGLRDYYPDLKVHHYVIMPNHIHYIIEVMDCLDGPSRATGPTMGKVGRFSGTLKRFCNREIGHNIWQSRSHDRIIRNEAAYRTYVEYIKTNPMRWTEDRLYIPE